ncbi:hypothetical protein H0H93_001660 [Arthromyces matolae]|nr:hypothetical protein H0H93_001660 [Arthromyces matolae]
MASECEVSDVDNGFFDTMDELCGIPPCPNGLAWDYGRKMCISCSTGVAPAKVDEHQLRRDLGTLEVNCPQVGAFHVPGGRTILRLANNIQAWAAGSEQGPTAEQLASNPQVQAAFQSLIIEWKSKHGRTLTQVQILCGKRWIYMDPNNRGNVFVRRVRVAGHMGRPTRISPPPTGSIGINLAHPGQEGTAVPEEYVLVATFHTHPSANPERYNPGLPSAQDNRLEWQRGVPGIIIQIDIKGPRARAQMDRAGPQDYPMANLDPGHTHENDRGTPVGSWVPNRVANQPPQSSPPASGSCWGYGDIYVRRLTNAQYVGRIMTISPPPTIDLAINLARPDLEVENPARAGYLMVATFHTHPSGPRARAQMGADGLPDFPMTNEDQGQTHLDDPGHQVGTWAPSRVENQPPVSSPPASASCWGCTHGTDLKR